MNEVYDILYVNAAIAGVITLVLFAGFIFSIWKENWKSKHDEGESLPVDTEQFIDRFL